MIITDTEARRTATSYAGGKESALTALSTSGAILPEVLDEIMRVTRAYAETEHDRKELACLALYCLNYGERGPVAGWANLNF